MNQRDQACGVEPWRTGVSALAAALGTDLANGLTAQEATRRLSTLGPNELLAATPISRWRQFAAQFADPLVYLLLAGMVVSFGAWIIEGQQGVPFEVIVILAIVTLNATLGFVQEYRAEQALAALQRMTAPTAMVVRDGRSVRVPSSEIVPGDLLALAEGDAVSADARLVEVASLMVAEASLTGESEAVAKNPTAIPGSVELGDRVNMVFSGTAVTSGRGLAVVTTTGMNTEMGTIARLLGESEQQHTPLQDEVNRVGRQLGVAVLVIAIVVVATMLFTSDLGEASTLVDILLIGVSLAIAAVPEGLPAILSVVLAGGVQRMARQRAIVKKLSSVETLGSASIVCSDKTGTLTKNEMTIEKVVSGSGEVDVSGTGYAPFGDLQVDGQLLTDPLLLREVRMVLSGGCLANNATLRNEQGSWLIQGDPTDAAFLVAEEKVGVAEARRARFRRVGEIPFTSERKLMTSLEADGEHGGQIAIVSKGAPDVVLPRCSHERVAGEVRELTEQRRAEILGSVDRLADKALRTLSVAYRQMPDGARPQIDETIESDLTYLGMVGIIDPPRTEAIGAVARAHAAGVRVMMITGDHPHTASRIARDLGISDGSDVVLIGADISSLDDEALKNRLRTTAVCARVAPQHKLRIVKALKADGHIVAMTGDGVNDAPALKSADIGIAMGVNGTDVTKQAADMVLADDNFATIIGAVREGRAIFTNIRKFIRFLLSSNMGEVFTVFFGVLFASGLGLRSTGEAIAAPLLATQILWINLMTDAAPALALGFDPSSTDVMQRSPRRSTDRVIDREMWIGILFVGIVMAVVTLVALDLRLAGGPLGGSGSIAEARTMAVTTLVLAQLFNVFNARSDRASAFTHLFTNRLLWLAVALSIVLQVAVVHVPFLNDAFDTTPLTRRDWLICTGLASTVLWANEAKKLIRRRSRRA